MHRFDLIIGSSVVRKGQKVIITNPYDGMPVSEVTFGGAPEIEEVIHCADDAFAHIAHMPSHERADILRRIADGIANCREELAEVIRDEAGKPIRLARAEVDRARSTFSIAANEVLRPEGDLIPLDSVPAGEGRIGLIKRFPIGPLLAITPFNFPLNLVAHKVAPAIAAGNSIVVKPSSQAPGAALMLSEITRNAGLPTGVLNVLPCFSQVSGEMVAHPGFKMLTFTGSPGVGWELKERAGKKRVTLELGGNAAALLEPDTDIDNALERLATSSFAYAGQVCISLQRIFVHEAIATRFIDRFVDYVTTRVACGNPSDPAVICGPMIDHTNADRIEQWVSEARQNGARLLCGGARTGNLIMPTVLTDVDPVLRIASQEAFGPVVLIDVYRSFDEGLAKVNNSAFGLQTAVFTHNIERVLQAFRELEVGGIIHNDAPSFRVDSMPYGGVKDSGFGREGVRYAIEEMTEPRLLVLKES